MGRPNGRPPVPAELNALRGNPGRRKHPAPPPSEKPSTNPPTPRDLKAAGREAWRLYWTYGKAWLAFTDLPLVTRICQMTDMAAQMNAQIDQEGLLILNEKTGRSAAHYLLSQLLGVYKNITDLEREAGMTPTARTRLRAEPTDTGDEIDRWSKAAG